MNIEGESERECQLFMAIGTKVDAVTVPLLISFHHCNYVLIEKWFLNLRNKSQQKQYYNSQALLLDKLLTNVHTLNSNKVNLKPCSGLLFVNQT